MKKRRSRKKDKVPFYIILVIVVAFFVNYYMEKEQPKTRPTTGADAVLQFPTDLYPETGRHIKEAIEAGESAICTIDRDEADERRKQSLKGIPTKKGYDRDEWPMAMCAEGGAGADIKYIDPSDNRGAGSWVSNQLENYPDGTRVEFVFRE